MCFAGGDRRMLCTTLAYVANGHSTTVRRFCFLDKYHGLISRMRLLHARIFNINLQMLLVLCSFCSTDCGRNKTQFLEQV
jgi:hypothetical protein